MRLGRVATGKPACDDLHIFTPLSCRRLQQNQFGGTLPGSWATSLPNLQVGWLGVGTESVWFMSTPHGVEGFVVCK
jgi:hypothetical protein